ncbi:MAG: YggU family protein [Kiritimatiellae bacterium]|nr:YggU family protein [Kiritimatiellia bacterium]
MSFFTDTPDGIILNVRAQPRSSRAGIDGLIGDAVKVRIRSAPVDGKANKELVETIADAFVLPKSRVVFKSGETSKTKRILLGGCHDVSAVEKVCGL